MKRRNSRNRALMGVIAAAAIAAAGLTTPPLAERAFAQAEQQGQAPVIAEIKQVRLTDKHVQGFLTSQRGLIAITDKLEKAGDTIDEKLQAELDDIAKKGGFKDFYEFEVVRTNVMMVLAGVDPESGTYTDPIDLIKKDIEAIKADSSLAEPDRKQQLEELTEALKEMQPLQYKENIALVQKHFKEIDEVLK